MSATASSANNSRQEAPREWHPVSANKEVIGSAWKTNASPWEDIDLDWMSRREYDRKFFVSSNDGSKYETKFHEQSTILLLRLKYNESAVSASGYQDPLEVGPWKFPRRSIPVLVGSMTSFVLLLFLGITMGIYVCQFHKRRVNKAFSTMSKESSVESTSPIEDSILFGGPSFVHQEMDYGANCSHWTKDMGTSKSTENRNGVLGCRTTTDPVVVPNIASGTAKPDEVPQWGRCGRCSSDEALRTRSLPSWVRTRSKILGQTLNASSYIKSQGIGGRCDPAQAPRGPLPTAESQFELLQWFNDFPTADSVMIYRERTDL